jgi:hypothetical protein
MPIHADPDPQHGVVDRDYICLGEARACEERARSAMLDAARLAGDKTPAKMDPSLQLF